MTILAWGAIFFSCVVIVGSVLLFSGLIPRAGRKTKAVTLIVLGLLIFLRANYAEEFMEINLSLVLLFLGILNMSVWAIISLTQVIRKKASIAEVSACFAASLCFIAFFAFSIVKGGYAENESKARGDKIMEYAADYKLQHNVLPAFVTITATLGGEITTPALKKSFFNYKISSENAEISFLSRRAITCSRTLIDTEWKCYD